MYCKNCGQQIDNNAAVCIHCGVAANNGNRFCPNCGREIPTNAQFCTGCGVSFGPPYQRKSKMAAGLLGIFLGWIGVHNFYLGYTTKAVIQLVLGICSCGTISGIWGLIEGIMILTGSIAVDGLGHPLGE